MLRISDSEQKENWSSIWSSLKCPESFSRGSWLWENSPVFPLTTLRLDIRSALRGSLGSEERAVSRLEYKLTARYKTYSVVQQPILQFFRVDFVVRVKHVCDVIEHLGEKTGCEFSNKYLSKYLALCLPVPQ